MPDVFKALVEPFRSGESVNRLLLGLFVLLNGIVLINACLHDPTIGYDGPQHLRYVKTLATGHLPTPTDSREFFSPPLPYVFPASLMAVSSIDVWWAAKLAQLLNVLISIALTIYLLKLCDLLRPDRPQLKIASLLLLTMLPVFYKTFSFVRGEPFVAFFAVFVVHRILVVFVKRSNRRADVVILGVALGLLVISRQWGLLLFPPLILFVGVLGLKDARNRWPLLRALCTSLLISLMIGGWFYINLLWKYGGVTAFNREPSAEFALSNQPKEFYFGLGSGKLFTDPVRNSFPNQLIPIYYSEIWGDYWEYFLVYARRTESDSFVSGRKLTKELEAGSLETNRDSINGYLGRVNLVSLLPFTILVAGGLNGLVLAGRFIRDRAFTEDTAAASLFILVVVSCLAGYFWFLVRYPDPPLGTTIKASYTLHVFPFLALLAGNVIDSLRQRSNMAYRIAVSSLGIVLIHNLGAVFTHYIPW